VLAVLWAAWAPAATHTVRAQNLSFVPDDLTIAVGDTVMFTDGNNFHTLTGDVAAEPFCGNGLYTTCSVTFDQAGTFNYHCIPHANAGMRGIIRVVSGGVTSPLTVQIQGQGTVTPDLNGQELLVGNTYVITALPAVGFVFSGWTGGVTASVARLSFVMEPNLVLEANFQLNPFPAKSRSYNGLFFIDDGVQHESSGSFSFVLTKTGKYSGSLQLAGKRSGFSGQFAPDGTATNVVKRGGTNVLSLELSLEEEGNAVEGRVLNPGAGWVAELQGDAAPTFVGTEASPYQGRYTLIMPNEELGDFGDGIGSVNVDAKGKLRLAGTLADSSPVTQSVPVSANGLWPLYVPLYGGKGSLLSWVGFSNAPAPAASLYGEMSWIKPSLPGRLYPEGFTNELDLVGSVYQPPGTNRVLQLDMGVVTFEGGDLTGAHTNLVTLGPKNQLTSLSTNQSLVVKIALPTGLLSGTLKLNDGGQNKKLSFKGAILQRQNLAAGFFLSTNRSGSVQLRSLP
jgi:plastocyanin